MNLGEHALSLDEYVDMVNNESPLKRKSLWNRIKVGVIAVLGFSVMFGSYLTYDKAQYYSKSSLIREAYLAGDYFFAEKLCTEQSYNTLFFGLVAATDNPETLKLATQKIHMLEYPDILDEERRKIHKDIEILLFDNSTESILRLSQYVGSYSESIDSLSQTKTANDVLSKVLLADYDAEMYLNKEDIAFLTKIILENERHSTDSITNSINNSVIDTLDYENYYEKNAEKLLYQSMTDTNKVSMGIQNLYLQAINAATDKMMNTNETGLYGEYMKIKIQELTSKLNLVNDYVQVLKYVNRK